MSRIYHKLFAPAGRDRSDSKEGKVLENGVSAQAVGVGAEGTGISEKEDLWAFARLKNGFNLTQVKLEKGFGRNELVRTVHRSLYGSLPSPHNQSRIFVEDPGTQKLYEISDKLDLETLPERMLPSGIVLVYEPTFEEIQSEDAPPKRRSDLLRRRGRSVSGRLRRLSSMFRRGEISEEQKRAMKDLVISGDRQVEDILDHADTGEISNADKEIPLSAKHFRPRGPSLYKDGALSPALLQSLLRKSEQGRERESDGEEFARQGRTGKTDIGDGGGSPGDVILRDAIDSLGAAAMRDLDLYPRLEEGSDRHSGQQQQQHRLSDSRRSFGQPQHFLADAQETAQWARYMAGSATGRGIAPEDDVGPELTPPYDGRPSSNLCSRSSLRELYAEEKSRSYATCRQGGNERVSGGTRGTGAAARDGEGHSGISRMRERGGGKDRDETKVRRGRKQERDKHLERLVDGRSIGEPQNLAPEAATIHSYALSPAPSNLAMKIAIESGRISEDEEEEENEQDGGGWRRERMEREYSRDFLGSLRDEAGADLDDDEESESDVEVLVQRQDDGSFVEAEDVSSGLRPSFTSKRRPLSSSSSSPSSSSRSPGPPFPPMPTSNSHHRSSPPNLPQPPPSTSPFASPPYPESSTPRAVSLRPNTSASGGHNNSHSPDGAFLVSSGPQRDKLRPALDLEEGAAGSSANTVAKMLRGSVATNSPSRPSLATPAGKSPHRPQILPSGAKPNERPPYADPNDISQDSHGREVQGLSPIKSSHDTSRRYASEASGHEAYGSVAAAAPYSERHSHYGSQVGSSGRAGNFGATTSHNEQGTDAGGPVSTRERNTGYSRADRPSAPFISPVGAVSAATAAAVFSSSSFAFSPSSSAGLEEGQGESQLCTRSHSPFSPSSVLGAQRCLSPGRLGDKYGVHRTVGRGRFSVVRMVERLEDGKVFAAKIVDKVMVCRPPSSRYIRSEVEILSQFSYHEGIVRLVEVFEEEDTIALVMEFATGDLFEFVEENGCLPESIARKIVRRLLATTALLHEHSIVHRDIKPENILIMSGDVTDIKLADFGVAKQLKSDREPHRTARLERAHTRIGTRDYIAPEVYGRSGYGTKADVWSIGIVAYILLCGQPPREGSTWDMFQLRSSLEGAAQERRSFQANDGRGEAEPGRASAGGQAEQAQGRREKGREEEGEEERQEERDEMQREQEQQEEDGNTDQMDRDEENHEEQEGRTPHNLAPRETGKTARGRSRGSLRPMDHIREVDESPPSQSSGSLSQVSSESGTLTPVERDVAVRTDTAEMLDFDSTAGLSGAIGHRGHAEGPATSEVAEKTERQGRSQLQAQVYLQSQSHSQSQSASRLEAQPLHPSRSYRFYRKPHLHFPESLSISEQAKSLISLMLQEDPERRISASDACSHEWFRDL